MQVTIEQLPAIATPLVNKFYQQHKARGRANRQEQVWVVRNSENNEIIAACRLIPLDNSLLLVGVFVAPECRGRKLASQLINKALAAQTKTVFTFPYKHIEAWYLGLGFQQLNDTELPQEVREKFAAYVKQGRDICYLGYFDS